VLIAAISGSLQARSGNTALLDVAARVAGPDVEVERFLDLESVKAFNPDHEEDVPPSVAALRALLERADGVLIATPEYAFGVPGALKNAFDWMVGSGHFYEKRVAILSAAPSVERGVHARRDVERTLGAQGAVIVHSASVATRAQTADDVDEEARAVVATAIAALRG
jgi:NAD(P)H-dependent FMN reductase